MLAIVDLVGESEQPIGHRNAELRLADHVGFHYGLRRDIAQRSLAIIVRSARRRFTMRPCASIGGS